MKDNVYLENMNQLINEKKIPISRIDDAVARVLRVKFRLGLFDKPYTTVLDEKERYLQPESKALAAKLAEESMVLLKNLNGILPLASAIKKLAVIGPMVKDKDNLMGAWSCHGSPKDVESIYEGLENEFGSKVQLSYALGCSFDGTDESGFEEATAVAGQSDAVVVCLGEKSNWSGENGSRSTIALPVIQEKLIASLKKTGKPIILVLSNGRPIELARIEPLTDAIIEIWQPGIAGGTPLAGILSGRVNPSGKLPITFPLTSGQIPIYYDMRQSARPTSGKYQDISTDPLYWFGYGMSYTTFKYGDIKLSTTKLKRNEKLIAEVEVSNTGEKDGKETVHWYIYDPVCSISRPMKELKYFEKKKLKAGTKSVYTFEIDPMRDLSYVDATGAKFLESGDFYLIVNDKKIKFTVED
jgi:beta-glucosidase